LWTGVAALLAVSVSAQAVQAAPGWRKAKMSGVRGEDSFDVVVSGSRSSAWALGTRNGSRTKERIAFHWNGKKWRSTPLPSRLTTGLNGGQFSFGAATVSASNGRNAWAASTDETEDSEKCSELKKRPTALSHVVRWTGRKWAVALSLKCARVTSVAAVGRDGAQIFGRDAKGPLTWRSAGGRWKSSRTDFATTEAKSSGKHIWALAENVKKPGRVVLRHYDGRRWHTVKTDSVLPRSSEKDGIYVGWGGLSVIGKKVSFNAQIVRPDENDPVDGISLESRLLTWDGRAWSRATPEALQGWSTGPFVPDGRGGVFTLAWSDEMTDDSPWLFHRAGGGAWKAASKGSTELRAIASGPVAGSLWGAGARDGRWDEDGLIMRYGR